MEKVFLHNLCRIFALSLIILPLNLLGASRVSVILDTDMGNDIDDALALVLLYQYANDGFVDILGVMSNKSDMSSVEYIDILNNYYGYGHIPIGKLTDSPVPNSGKPNYASVVAQDKSFKRTIKDYSNLPESVDLYRQILAAQADSSVVIISVGFLTNLSKLLVSKADNFSPLTGVDLVKKKVKYLSLMGGDFRVYGQHPEYNIRNDIKSSKIVIDNWPTSIVFSPWELGILITYPAFSILNDFSYDKKNPLVIAYQSYDKMPYDRPTWDLTSVMYVAEGVNFGISSMGTVAIDNQGFSSFRFNLKGRHQIISADPWQSFRIKKRFVELIKQMPGR